MWQASNNVDGLKSTLGYDEPTKSQEEIIHHFIKNKDDFVCLSTSLGKSLCYATLPH